MQTTILVLHILVCVVLIILVLLQSGRDGMGVIFGGGGNSSVFGSQGAGGILSKLTAFLAALFIVTSLGYNIMFSSNTSNNRSVLDVQFENVSTETAPSTPTTPANSPVATPDSTTSTDTAKVTETTDNAVETASQPNPTETSNTATATENVEVPAVAEPKPTEAETTQEVTPAETETTSAQ